MRYLPKSSKANKNSALALMITGVLVLCASLLLSISFGASKYSFFEMIGQAMSGGGTAANILIFLRLPRTLAAALAGAGLACAGAVIQNVLINPLAGPNIIGVNSGAGLAAALVSSLLPLGTDVLPIAAMAGALFAMLLIYSIARTTGASKITIVLSGVAVNALFNAGADAVHTLFPDTLIGGSYFRIGGFAGMEITKIFPAGWYIIAGILLALLMGGELDVLSLGEENAESLGQRTGLIRFIMLFIASMMAGASVSFAGLLGFVGLIVPHAVRPFAKGSSRLLIFSCALFGASFVLISDCVSRLIFMPYEMPVGIIMAFVGGPFFIYLLMRRGGYHD